SRACQIHTKGILQLRARSARPKAAWFADAPLVAVAAGLFSVVAGRYDPSRHVELRSLTPSPALPRVVSCSTHGSAHAPPTSAPRGAGLFARLPRRLAVARRARHARGRRRAPGTRR